MLWRYEKSLWLLIAKQRSSSVISSSKEQKKLLNSFSKIVTYYSLALFLLIGGSCMWSNQFWFDLKLGRYIQSRIGSRQIGLCQVCIVDQTKIFQGMFQVLCCIFILINKEEGSPKQEAKSFWTFLLIAVLLMLS